MLGDNIPKSHDTGFIMLPRAGWGQLSTIPIHGGWPSWLVGSDGGGNAGTSLSEAPGKAN